MPMIFSGEYRLRLILTSFPVSRFYHNSNLKSESVFGGRVTRSDEKTVSLEGHEDIVSVIEKLPECYDNPDIAMEIYTDDAIFMRPQTRTGQMVKVTGPKEIGDYKKEKGKGYVVSKISINSIKRETDKAHVEYTFHRKTIEGRDFGVPLEGTAEMVKKGQTWKIKKDKIEYW